MCHNWDDVARNHQNWSGVTYSNIPDLRERKKKVIPKYCPWVQWVCFFDLYGLLMKRMRLMCLSESSYRNSVVSEHSCVCNSLHSTVHLRLTAAPSLGTPGSSTPSASLLTASPWLWISSLSRIGLLLRDWAAGSERKSHRGVPKKKKKFEQLQDVNRISLFSHSVVILKETILI